MRFLSTKRLVVLLAAVLATSSLVSSLSIPKNRDVEVDFLANGPAGLDKRAVAPPKPHAVATTSKPAAEASTTRTTARAASTTARPSTTSARPAASSSASSSSPPSSSSPAVSSSSISAAANSASSMSSSQTPIPTDTTNSTTSQSQAVPTGGLSTGAVAGIGAVCGVAVVGAGIFAMVRYKRKASLTQNLSNKSVNQFSAPSPYPATSPFPAGNTGYERLSDPSLSGASVPSGVPQQGVGTFTVISTYTPTLGDELEIQPGDKVTILVEYDDGWCQGVNESRGKVKGVFPKHCVDYGNNQGVVDDAGRSKRVSSMYGSGGYRM